MLCKLPNVRIARIGLQHTGTRSGLRSGEHGDARAHAQAAACLQPDAVIVEIESIQQVVVLVAFQKPADRKDAAQ